MVRVRLWHVLFVNWIVSLAWAAGLYLVRVLLLRFGWSKWIGVLTFLQALTWFVVASWTVALVVYALAKGHPFDLGHGSRGGADQVWSLEEIAGLAGR